ncbi:P-loop ATPase, Sll1717 family [Ralstonia nicotianae]
MDKYKSLRSTTFGHRVAEEETDALSAYFVETDSWERVFRGDIDVIYGAKGAGKSALYSLMLSRNGDLFDRNILLVAAENPRGAPAFKNLLLDPPASEREFVNLWKLYFISLLHNLLTEYGIKSDATTQLQQALEREGLVKGNLSLAGLLSGIVDYVRGALRPQAIEGGIELDPISQLPKGFKGKIIFSEPSKAAVDPDLRSVDALLELANTALASTKFKAWILLDRLDVAFSENEELEANALRALFRVYLDLLAYPNIQQKIFLRSDIWARITADGFREASHVTRHLTIAWNKNSLLNLVVRRALHNDSIREGYGVTEALGRSTVVDQEQFFYKIFPDQVDIGANKPTTLDWLLSRTRDGTRVNAPRELIHLLNSLRDVQVKRFELGDQPEPEQDQLFARVAFKEALPEVSKVRLEQTLYAEHPDQKPWLEKLRGEKTLHTPDSLSQIWGTPIDDAAERAIVLSNVGFFEQRGTKQVPEFWVPFLYREALGLVQGSAE